MNKIPKKRIRKDYRLRFSILISSALQKRVRFDCTRRRAFFTYALDDSEDNNFYIYNAHALFKVGIEEDTEQWYDKMSNFSMDNLGKDLEDLKIHFLNVKVRDNDLIIEIINSNSKITKKVSIFIIKRKINSFVWFDVSRAVANGTLCHNLLSTDKLIICDKNYSEKLAEIVREEDLSLDTDWNKVIQLADESNQVCAIIDFGKKSASPTYYIADSSPCNTFSSISELMYKMPKQEYQWKYRFDNTLKCDITETSFKRLLAYSKEWAFNILVELYCNPEFYNMIGKGYDSECRILIKQYKEAFGIWSDGYTSIFGEANYRDYSGWEDAVEKMAKILPTDIRVIHLAGIQVKINGHTYWNEDDYYKIEDYPSSAHSDYPGMLLMPAYCKHGIVFPKNKFPAIHNGLKRTILFPMLSLNSQQRQTVYKLEKTYRYNEHKDGYDKEYNLFTNDQDYYKVEAPFLINRRLPLPLIISGYNDTYYLVCHLTDKIELIN